MSDPSTGTGKYVGIGVVLLIAIAALLLFQRNLFGVRDMLLGQTDDNREAIHRPSTDGGPGSDGGEGPDVKPFDPTRPDPVKYQKAHDTPLPKRLTIQRKAGKEIVELPMLLVPQGWYIMGENDGVRSNMPKRWVWLDDYYLSESEVTNEQYYSFVIDRGYESGRYWSEEGFKFIGEGRSIRGSFYVGWRALHEPLRLWALASPRREVTLEVLSPDRITGVSGSKVLVLPETGNTDWKQWLQVDRTNGAVRIKDIANQWQDVSGADPGLMDKVKTARLLHTTDASGRISLSDLGDNFWITIVAWADGDLEKPIMGTVARSDDHKLRGAEMPVLGISWYEADACARFFGGSLPTEAQWEKAARGDKGGRYPWGDEAEWSMNFTVDGVTRVTTPFANINRWRVVATKSFDNGKGPYGHHDLAGNVSEWCADVYLERPDWSEANPYNRGGERGRRAERGTNCQDDEAYPAYHRRSSDAFSRGNMPRGFRIAMKPDDALRLANGG